MLQMLFVLRCVAAEACLGVPSLSSLICAPCRQAWDLAVDICLSQLPTIIEEGTAFRVSLWKRKPCCPFSFCPRALRRSSRCPPGRSAAQTDSSGLQHQSESAGRESVFLFEAALKGQRHQPFKPDSGGLLLTGDSSGSSFTLALPLLHLFTGGRLLHGSPGASLPASDLCFPALVPRPLCWKCNWASEEL